MKINIFARIMHFYMLFINSFTQNDRYIEQIWTHIYKLVFTKKHIHKHVKNVYYKNMYNQMFINKLL